MKKTLILLLVLTSFRSWAQKEFNTWYFGLRVGVYFSDTGPRTLTDGAMNSGEGCATISDARGNLLFYTNGIKAWNRQHRLMTNGFGLGGFADSLRSEVVPNSATQGATIVPKPGSASEYYIFMVDAAENGLQRGLQYAVVDMALEGGLGAVTRKAVPVPVPIGDGRLTEKLVAVRHANQQDYWIVVHGWNSNVFASFLLTAAGLAPAPLLSAGGSVHQGGGNARHDYNAIGYLKASPNGRLLVSVQESGPLELFDFNYGTGIVSGPRRLADARLPGPIHYYGAEFSPNGWLLYVGWTPKLLQYDLQTGAIVEIAHIAPSMLYALQLGPDQKIYGSLYGQFLNAGMCVVSSPNTPGLGCGYQYNALAGFTYDHKCYLGLPNVTARPPVPGELLANFGLLRSAVCQGEAMPFAASLYPAVPDAVVTWEFGEPARGSANTASGRAVTHQFLTAGVYVVTMRVQQVSGVVTTYAQSVTVVPPTSARLVVGQQPACAGTPTLLTVTPAQPPGTVYRWQDGATTASLNATTSGRYWVEVTAPQRCPVRDSVVLNFLPAPLVSLGPDQLVCADQHILLSPGSQPSGSVYRWQDGSNQPSFEATQPGDYKVTVTSVLGCSTQAQMTVRFGDDCPFFIPNIITPNGDGQNEAFAPQGLEPNAWNLEIYNRWGTKVYAQARYAGTWTANGQAAGSYYYLLKHAINGRQYKGWLQVQR